MKRTHRIAMIVAAVFLVVGLLVGGAAFAAMQFDYTRLNTDKTVTNTHTVDKAFTSITVDSGEFNLCLIPSTDDVCKVVCRETDKISHTVTVENGTLTVRKVDNRKWFDRIGIFWGDLAIEIYLPQTRLDALKALLDTGDVELPADFAFNTVEIDTDTGSILCSATVENNLTVHSDTGRIEITGTSPGRMAVSTDTGKIGVSDATCENISVESSTGDIALERVVASNDLQICNDTGDVQLTDSDGDSIFIETATGDVTGTLLSEKVFITETDTGRVDVPKSTTGGRCEIETDTGDSQIRIQ